MCFSKVKKTTIQTVACTALHKDQTSLKKKQNHFTKITKRFTKRKYKWSWCSIYQAYEVLHVYAHF